MREPLSSRLNVNGIDLHLFEWPADGPVVFFAHATGFHARCWDQVIERLPEVHAYAIDMRGHGRSDTPEPPYPWKYFGEDVAAVARELGFEGVLAAGHSKGGHAITAAAALEPRAFGQLLLIDPVIGPKETMREQPWGEGDHFAARRRNEWASPQEMFDRFAAREPFSRWDPAVLRDYCEYGLLPNESGEGYVLACPPRIEAAVYAGAHADAAIYDAIASIEIPVRILRARQREGAVAMDMSGSPTVPDLARHFRNAEDVYLPRYSHFMPMEDPGFIAGQVRELLARA